MKVVEVSHNGEKIKITDDITFKEVVIYPEININLETFISKLTVELLKEE